MTNFYASALLSYWFVTLVSETFSPQVYILRLNFPELSQTMNNVIKNTKLISKRTTLNCNEKLLDLSLPLVMGIVNLTPDSFYSGSRAGEEGLMDRISKMVSDGADIIDLGGYSSRPGAQHITTEEEWGRLAPALEIIRKEFPEVVISVDTFRAEIADRSVSEYRVDIINDISAGELDEKMFETIARLQVPYILMHMQGTPQTMQQQPTYRDLMREIVRYFSSKIEALKSMGVHDMIIDPGFGFGKSLEHNYELLGHLDEFKIFEQPLLAGVSRKSMIYKYLDSDPEQALNGTTVLHTIALQKGAQILRVHDVKEAKETVSLVSKVFGDGLWFHGR